MKQLKFRRTGAGYIGFDSGKRSLFKTRARHEYDKLEWFFFCKSGNEAFLAKLWYLHLSIPKNYERFRYNATRRFQHICSIFSTVFQRISTEATVKTTNLNGLQHSFYWIINESLLPKRDSYWVDMFEFKSH